MIFLEQLGAGDVARHEVRRELHAREREVERLRDRLDEQRLREAGDADEEHVAAGQERRDEIVDDLLLADDAAADLRDQLRARVRELLEHRDVARIVHHYLSRGHAGSLLSRFEVSGTT